LTGDNFSEGLSEVGVEDGVDDGVQSGVDVAEPSDEADELKLKNRKVWKRPRLLSETGQLILLLNLTLHHPLMIKEKLTTS